MSRGKARTQELKTLAVRDKVATSCSVVPNQNEESPAREAHLCSIWNASLLAPEERVTPDGYHVWNWNPRGTGSEKKQARHTSRLAEHLTYLPRGQDLGGRESGRGEQRKSEPRIYQTPQAGYCSGCLWGGLGALLR